MAEPNKDADNYIITKILKRKNELKRPKVANIDQLIIIVTANKPKPDLYLIDKLIVSCLIKDITPVIVINKIDVSNNNQVNLLINQYKNVVDTILSCSAITFENIDDVKNILKNKTSVFAGQSAVGKSSILNAISPLINQSTNKLSKIGRGRHTTREIKIFVLEDNILIADTPGFSLLDLEIDHTQLTQYYPEFQEFKCKYSGCSHILEDGCKVIEAVDLGEINKERYLRYCKIYSELKVKWERKYD